MFVDVNGQVVEWSCDVYVLLICFVGQQFFLIFVVMMMVECEVLFEGIMINGEQFEMCCQVMFDFDVMVVCDIDKGFCYFVVDKEIGECVVQDDFDLLWFFLVGGVFWDELQDFLLLLVGFNWFFFDFCGIGIQMNVFFVGLLLFVNFVKLSVFGSKFDVGLDVFGFVVVGIDLIF